MIQSIFDDRYLKDQIPVSEVDSNLKRRIIDGMVLLSCIYNCAQLIKEIRPIKILLFYYVRVSNEYSYRIDIGI